MGGIKKTLFGSPSKLSSQTGNHAYDTINGAFSPALGYVTGAGSMLSNLLGVGGGPAQTTALNNFANSGGMQFLMEQGQKAVTSSKAAQGLLQSGSYGTALEKYGQGLASTYLNQYMQDLQGLGNLGINAGSVLSGAGQYGSTTSSGAKKGILGDLIKAGATVAASDPSLKTNVVLIGQAPDGLKIYEYNYVDDPRLPKGRQKGVMAPDVLKLRPWAYVPNVIDNLPGVDYGKLGRLD